MSNNLWKICFVNVTCTHKDTQVDTRFTCNLRVNSAVDMLYELIGKYSVLFITIQTRTMFTCMQLRLPTHKQRRVSYVLIHTHTQIKSKQARSQNAHKNKRTGSPTCWIYHHAFTLYVLAKKKTRDFWIYRKKPCPAGFGWRSCHFYCPQCFI